MLRKGGKERFEEKEKFGLGGVSNIMRAIKMPPTQEQSVTTNPEAIIF